MTLKEAAYILNSELTRQSPKNFTSTWIFINTPRVYKFVRLNFRTELDEIDWDTITRKLDRDHQKKWAGRKRKPKPYENSLEVQKILERHGSKLYTFISPLDRNDQDYADHIAVSLVRVAQRGNVLAQQEALKWIRYTVDEWIEYRWALKRWGGYADQLDEQILACFRRYRFTGCFLGYVYKTLEFSGRALRPTYSLDEPLFGSERTRAESVVQDPETGEIRMFEKSMFSFS